MTPKDRLKEIETKFKGTDLRVRSHSYGKDMEWLISRIKQLEAALWKITTPDMAGVQGMIICDMGFQHFAEYTARRALEGEEEEEEK